MRLEGKVAIVTGAANGIGRATAIRLGREGARLVLNDVRADGLARVAGEAAAPDRVRQVAGDVSQEATAEAIAHEAVSGFGRIDVLVNNAGVHHFKDPVETTLEEWNRVIANNLTSMFLCTKHVLPVMLRQRSGAIVNLSSISSCIGQEVNGTESTFVYNVSKAGARQLTTSLATRYAADGIRVNCVCPGAARTRAYEDFTSDAVEIERLWTEDAAAAPVGRVADPSEIAAVIAFLASDDASFMTGSAVVCDGGYLSR
ncbi:MAG TPA: SDR family oxidoreductase [Candidatus Binatia bacterium]|jgi:NAD(P)-dependent dehydrogenase (short-subunit alcohol dehydrogenase family)|nr:SDR family oxidoreductase [Candidatus Binatia bacterium]